jgi:hypothetical protein
VLQQQQLFTTFDMINPQQLIDKPDRFYGHDSENPFLWLRNVQNWIDALEIEEKYILKIVPTFLKNNAAAWWDMEKPNIKTWTAFKNNFQEFFISADIEEAWWSELESTKQGTASVNELQLVLEELFSRLSISDSTTKKRYLLKALNPKLAYEVERNGTTDYLSTIKNVKKAETLLNKYHFKNEEIKKNQEMNKKKENLHLLTNTSSGNETKSTTDNSIQDSLTSLADNFNNLRIFLVNQQQQQQQQQQQPQYSQYQAHPNNNHYSNNQQRYGEGYNCYNCGGPGHLSRNCPEKHQVNETAGKGRGQ